MKRLLPIAALLLLTGVGIAPPAAAVTTVPAYDHVFFTIMENHSRTQTLVSGSYLAGLANQGAQSTQQFAIGHPSEPNYVALISGSTNGVTDDGTYNLSAPDITTGVEASGRSWKGYMETMPSPCFTGNSGNYVRKHNPFISFTAISGNPSRCNRIVPYAQLATDLGSAATTPSFVWITPNLCNDMHDCSVGTGDTWARNNFPAIFNSPAWKTQHSLFVFTNDEDDGSAGNNVPFFVLSSDGSTKTGYSSSVHGTHYSWLRTIEAAWGLGQMAAGDTGASPLTDLFAAAAASPSPTVSPSPSASASSSPSPTSAPSPSPVPSASPTGSGLLRVTSSPAVPTHILVDGSDAGTWGLDWVPEPSGQHNLCFSHVTGWGEPQCQTITITAGQTTTVVGSFTRWGELRVQTSPAEPATITIDGLNYGTWGVWTDIPSGSHTVCYGPLAGLTAPPCQTVSVVAGVETDTTGFYTTSQTIRAAFYYPWFPEAWHQGTPDPWTHYHPSAGFYDSSDPAVISRHIAAMQYGGIQAGIASWWGQGTATDQRISKLLTAAHGTGFQWSLYYEPSLTGSGVAADLAYINAHYGGDPNFLHQNGKPVVFVYSRAVASCADVATWLANNQGDYLNLQVFGGYRSCAQQPDSWHQYAPASRTDAQTPFSYSISPGFWKATEATPRLVRDTAAFASACQSMVASGAQWQLVTTFNEFGEGTQVESATEYASASGFGSYLDILHAC